MTAFSDHLTKVLGGLCFGHYADRFGPRWALLTAHGAAMSGVARQGTKLQRSHTLKAILTWLKAEEIYISYLSDDGIAGNPHGRAKRI